MSTIQRYPALDALRIKRTELALRTENIAAAISRGEATLADLEAEQDQLRKRALSAKGKAAAAQVEKFLSGGSKVDDIAPDQQRMVALGKLQGQIEVAAEGVRQLRAMHSNAIRELDAVDASRHTEVNAIITAAIEAQAATVATLRAEYLREGAILRELVPDDMYSSVNAGRFASADILRTLEDLPKENDFNVSGQVLRRGHARSRDRFSEMRDALLADDSDAEARESAVA